MIRRLFSRVILFLVLAPALHAQEAPNKPLGEYTLHDFAAKWMMQQDDLADLEHYAEENAALIASGDERRRIVLIGDSITYHWPEELLPDDSTTLFVNRGIPGQNTSQMLLRFEDDVVALRPAMVVIFAGTNDLRAHAGKPEDLRDRVTRQVQRNITAMVDIADARQIAVVLCAITPVGPSQAGVYRDPETILSLNRWLRRFSDERGLAFVDYHEAVSKKRILNPAFTTDDLHVNESGYRAMTERLLTAMDRMK